MTRGRLKSREVLRPAKRSRRARPSAHPQPQAHTPNQRTLFLRILREARPYWGHIGLIFTLSLVATPLALLGPLPLKMAVDSVLGSDPLPGFLPGVLPTWLTGSSVRLLIAIAVFQVLVVLMVQVQAHGTYFLQTYTGEKLTLRFQSRLLEHVQRLSFAFHDQRGTADSVYRIQYDAPAIQWVAVYGVIPLVTAAVTLVSMVFVVFSLDPQLAAVALVVAPLIYLSVRTFSARMRGRYKQTKEMESSALGVVQEVLTAFRVVKAFGREDDETERFINHSTRSLRARLRLAIAEGAFGILVSMTTAIGTAAVLFVGARSVQSGVLTLGELLMVLAYLGQLYAPLHLMSKQVTNLQGNLAGSYRAFELLDEAADVIEKPNARHINRVRGSVAFRDVTFGYGDDEPVLKGLSFEVSPGSRIGIVGRTGAGKSTLISLLTRFYDPRSGSVLLDDIDMKDYCLSDLRQQFSIVLQEPVLFSTTIAENIAYARPRARRDEIIQAAKAAEAHDFIMTLPEGYDTIVGERGNRLSGGERQRISLARAFLKDAPILVLDEPTSSVDVQTEAAIMKTMERLMEGRTTFMIAHRLSTLDACDDVIQISKEIPTVVSPQLARSPLQLAHT